MRTIAQVGRGVMEAIARFMRQLYQHYVYTVEIEEKSLYKFKVVAAAALAPGK